MESAVGLDPEARPKRKTTYSRDHPTENPKPSKRTKAEVQQAAFEKKQAAIQKKRLAEEEKEEKRLRDEKEKQLSARKIASIEDSVQRSQKQLQLRSERPDISTMETYRVMQKARQEKAVEESEIDVDMAEEDLAELPPASTVDTDSDGARLGLSDKDGENEAYAPSEDDLDEDKSSDDGRDSDASIERLYQKLQAKKKEKKKKAQAGELRAQIQAYRNVAPTVYARPNRQLLEEEGRNEKSTSEGIGGLKTHWKKGIASQLAPPPSSPPSFPQPSTDFPRQIEDPTRTRKSNAKTVTAIRPSVNREDSDNGTGTNGGEIGFDEDDDLLEAVGKEKEVREKNKSHKNGTRSMGVQLKTTDITAIKRNATARRSAKPRYKNSDLPFKNSSRDLETWREAVLPHILDWAGSLDEPFSISTHPDLEEITKYAWDEEFPEISADGAVHYVANSAIRNWRSGIGKHALQRLARIFNAEPFKNSKNQRKAYVANQLKDLNYTYRDPKSRTGGYRSSAIIEVFAFHHQIVNKTEKWYGYPTGALSLSAAAHERALKLWKNGDAPTKETKKSFVRRPWADRASQHLKVVIKLSEKKWQEIYEAAEEVVASVDNDFDAAEDGENSDNDDPSELIQISESEAED